MKHTVLLNLVVEEAQYKLKKLKWAEEGFY
jgi:hypothetical protein